jgi:hypothetical protein
MSSGTPAATSSARWTAPATPTRAGPNTNGWRGLGGPPRGLGRVLENVADEIVGDLLDQVRVGAGEHHVIDRCKDGQGHGDSADHERTDRGEQPI